jgi:hypothetical protein
MTALVLALEREYAFVTYRIRPMSADDIPVMTSWHYPPPYDFYDPDANEDDLAELSDPSRWGHEHSLRSMNRMRSWDSFSSDVPSQACLSRSGLAVELRLSIAVVTGYIDPGKPMSPVP